MVAGQVTGGFAHALGAALLEEQSYGADGSLQTGTLADYLIPTAMEVPDPIVLHAETVSPFTPLGTKGVGEGNTMSTPVCIANAVADAMGLIDVPLPLLPSRLSEALHGEERAPPARTVGPAANPDSAAKAGERALYGSGSAAVAAPPERLWAMLLDPQVLARVVPGAHGVQRVDDTIFRAEVTLGIGPVRGRYQAEIALSDLDAPRSVTLAGSVDGPLGCGRGHGLLRLAPDGPSRTVLHYTDEAALGGRVVSIAGRLLDGAARVIIGQFFAALAAQAAPRKRRLARLLAALRGRR